MVDGVTRTSEEEVKVEIVEFFRKLYHQESGGWRPRVDNLHFDTISLEDSIRLESPCSEKEVVEALETMAGDKAPGPDGFSLAFFKFCWQVVKVDVMAMMH